MRLKFEVQVWVEIADKTEAGVEIIILVIAMPIIVMSEITISAQKGRESRCLILSLSSIMIF
ncbi:hypothetical protein B9T19_00250 [Ignatzschineria sp. F8392]|nr:hypothetical protein B9T19_00250 [Ignatzschineria sp. F8392]